MSVKVQLINSLTLPHRYLQQSKRSFIQLCCHNMCFLENATTSPLSITQHHLSPWLPQKQTSCSSSEVVKNNQRGMHSDFWVCCIFLEVLMLPFCSIFSPPSLWPVDLHVNSHLWLLKSVWIKSWGRNIAVTWAVLTSVWQKQRLPNFSIYCSLYLYIYY